MRKLLCILAALICAACDVLTNAQLPVTHDDRVVGEWRHVPKPGEGPQTESLIVRRAGNEYLSGDGDDFAKNKASHFTLSKVGRLLVVQTQEGVGSNCEPFGKSTETCRTLYGTIGITQDQVVVRPFDSAKLVQDSLLGALKIPHQIRRTGRSDGKGESTVFFDANAKDLQTFLELYLPAHSSVYGDAVTYKRLR